MFIAAAVDIIPWRRRRPGWEVMVASPVSGADENGDGRVPELRDEEVL
jgi:hypothetical protein